MILKKIAFHNFRSFESVSFEINPFLTIVIGENARGKTNLLEGIHVLMHGEGFREDKEEELLYIDKKTGYVEGLFSIGDDSFMFKVAIDHKPGHIEKHFFVNKTKRQLSQYVQEQIKTVLFSPEKIEIINGSPSIRREYIDKWIAYYDFEYKKKLDNYTNAIRRRNKVLEMHKTEEQLKEELRFWNDYCMEQAAYIFTKRTELTEFLNKHPKLDAKSFTIEYQSNEFNQERLDKVYEEEKRWRKTLIGPQKDDFQISMWSKSSLPPGKWNPPAGKKNIHHYGSRSEQRMAVFWLKLNEILYYEETRKKKPLLLLDDVFSELDIHNKKIVLDLIKKYQSLVTTTEHEIVDIAEVPNTIIHI